MSPSQNAPCHGAFDAPLMLACTPRFPHAKPPGPAMPPLICGRQWCHPDGVRIPCRLLRSSSALALPACGPLASQIPWVASWAIPGPETSVWDCVFLASHLYFSPKEPALDGPLGSVVQLISGGMPPLPLVLQGQTSTAAAFPSS